MKNIALNGVTPDGYLYTVTGSNATIIGYTGSKVDIEIPATITDSGNTYSVTEIGFQAFYSQFELTSVTIPSSVIKIDVHAFGFCRGLKSINMSQGLVTIESDAFFYCTGITSLIIPDSVKYIGILSFAYCTGLTSVSVPSNVISIGRGAFGGCTGLTSIFVEPLNPSFSSFDNNLYDKSQTTLLCYPAGKTGPITFVDSMTQIGDGAFWGCQNLIDISIPNGVTNIGEEAFSGCTNLMTVTIPYGVISIGEEAFSSCISLQNVNIPNSVMTIGAYAFISCGSLTSMTMSNSVTTISAGMFLYCDGLASINIPNSVNTIGDSAFFGCTRLSNVDIPDSVTSIGSGAFCACKSMTNIMIPASVTSIGDGAFGECSSMISIDVANDNPVYSSFEDALYDKLQTTILRYPVGKTGPVTFPDTITSIGSGAFSVCINLTSITLPYGITSIGNGAFSNCTDLVSVIIPKSVIVIGYSSFGRCTSLTSVTIPDSVTSIYDEAFSGCDNLVEAKFFGNAPTVMGSDVFRSCPLNFKVYYLSGKTGFTNPWYGYPTEVFYMVTYNGNENTAGTVPEDSKTYLYGEVVEVLSNTGSLVRSGYTFMGWNTDPDGNGIEYVPGSTFLMGTSNVTLYAEWFTTEQLITKTVDDINTLLPEQNIAKSLTTKLNSVSQNLADGDETGALDQLNAFINEVSAQSGKKKISKDTGDYLIEQANLIIASINQQY